MPRSDSSDRGIRVQRRRLRRRARASFVGLVSVFGQRASPIRRAASSVNGVVAPPGAWVAVGSVGGLGGGLDQVRGDVRVADHGDMGGARYLDDLATKAAM
jgi:hypothetical protein